MKLILIRHVQTQGNAEKRYIGTTKSEYTQKGKNQIRFILDSLKNRDFDLVYSSPMPRVLKIAKKISQISDNELIIEDSLIEMNFGLFENKTYKEIRSNHKKEWDKWVNDYINYRIPSGETVIEVYKRVEEFISKLDKEGTYVIATHGGIIQTIITILLDLDIDQRWHFKIDTGSITEIEYKNNYGVLTKLNRT